MDRTHGGLARRGSVELVGRCENLWKAAESDPSSGITRQKGRTTMSDENTNDEGGTLTYDMVKTLKSNGTKPTVEQYNHAIEAVGAKIKTLAAGLAAKAIETGTASGKLHANVKNSPFPVDEEKKAAEALGKDMLAMFSEIGDEVRHLSKLVSWRDRTDAGLPEKD
jgi:hypothetical protein